MLLYSASTPQQIVRVINQQRLDGEERLWRYGVIIFFVESSNSPTILMVHAPRK
jgi:hypothetical protein